jgi:hypothetical protein
MRISFVPLLAFALVPACVQLQSNSDILNGSVQLPSEPAPSSTGAPLDATGLAGPELAPAEPVTAQPLSPSQGGLSGARSTVAALGDPTVPGLWMETPLVSAAQPARVRSAGGEVLLTLKPISGEASAGSRLSIDAMRALGAPLTELVEVTVYPAS